MDCILKVGANTHLMISHLPDTIAKHDYELSQPPDGSASWVEDLIGHATLLKQGLDDIHGSEEGMRIQVILGQIYGRTLIICYTIGRASPDWGILVPEFSAKKCTNLTTLFERP